MLRPIVDDLVLLSEFTIAQKTLSALLLPGVYVMKHLRCLFKVK